MKKILTLLLMSVLCSVGVKADEVTPTLPALPLQTLNVMTTTDYTSTNGYIVLNAYSDIFYSGSSNNTMVSWASASNKNSNNETKGSYTHNDGEPFTDWSASNDSKLYFANVKFDSSNSTYSTYAMRVTGIEEVQILGKTGGDDWTIYLDVREINGSNVSTTAAGKGTVTSKNSPTIAKVENLDKNKTYVIYVYATFSTSPTQTSNNRFYQIAFKPGSQSQSHDVTISDKGWASLYLPFNATIPSNVKAYYAKSKSENTITLAEITNVIPAETGVIIGGSAGTYSFTETSVTPTTITDNLFKGVTDETSCEASENYVLSGTSTPQSPKFALYSGTTLGAYKAYLPKNAVVNESKTIMFVFEENAATGIETVQHATSASVAKARKVLRNGRLLIEKEKSIFNLAGARINN